MPTRACPLYYSVMFRTVAALSFHPSRPARAEDWPQFLGPSRNGVYTGGDLAATWPAAGPAMLWKRDVGQGFSAPVVAAGPADSVPSRGESRDGGSDGREDRPQDLGDRRGDRLSRRFRLRRRPARGAGDCRRQDLHFRRGRRAAGPGFRHRAQAVERGHAREVRRAQGILRLGRGTAGGRRKVLVNTGGPNGAGIAAFDKETGKVLWTATNDESSYSAPVAATIGGVRHALFLTRAGFVDLDPATGKVRYQMKWRSRNDASVNAATPIVADDMVFLSASYGTGATVLQFAGGQWKQLWASDDKLSNHYATSVYRDGILYGYHGRQEYGPSLRAVEMKTGKVRWSVDDFGAGTVTLAGDRLLVLRESGELQMGPATPDAWRPSAKARLMEGTVRSYPALADGLLYVRNEKTLGCFNLRRIDRSRRGPPAAPGEPSVRGRRPRRPLRNLQAEEPGPGPARSQAVRPTPAPDRYAVYFGMTAPPERRQRHLASTVMLPNRSSWFAGCGDRKLLGIGAGAVHDLGDLLHDIGMRRRHIVRLRHVRLQVVEFHRLFRARCARLSNRPCARPG